MRSLIILKVFMLDEKVETCYNIKEFHDTSSCHKIARARWMQQTQEIETNKCNKRVKGQANGRYPQKCRTWHCNF